MASSPLRMRWLALVLMLLLGLCPSAAFAQSAAYQTINGQQTLDSLISQLRVAGYPGPWDSASVVAAYARATGGAVTLAGAPIVVEIGGVGTDQTPGGPWTVLEPYLGTAAPVRRYQYDTCADVSTNVQQLVSYVRTLRPNPVVLLGHSMGGVLALSAASSPDLAGEVRGVVIADAPVNGLSSDLVNFGESLGVVPSPCRALEQMEDPAWSARSSANAQRALAAGIRVLDISNGYDNMVPLAAQQLPQQVNLEFDVGTGLVNHTAIFNSVAALSAIAQFIRAL